MKQQAACSMASKTEHLQGRIDKIKDILEKANQEKEKWMPAIDKLLSSNSSNAMVVGSTLAPTVFSMCKLIHSCNSYHQARLSMT